MPPFLRDYISFYGRYDRGTFNLILFVAAVPWLVLTFADLYATTATVMDTLHTHKGNLADVEQALTTLAQQPAPFPTTDVLTLLIELALVPTYIKRLRDVGDRTDWVVVAYLPTFDKALGLLTGLSLPDAITLAGGLVALVVTLRLSLKGSAPRTAKGPHAPH
jgi:uncharacterized membrane protein YhaH (DUF805 family)